MTPGYKIKRNFTFILIAFFIIFSLNWFYESQVGRKEIRFGTKVHKTSESIEFTPLPEVKEQLENVRKEKEKAINKALFDEKVAKAEALLRSYNSPMQGYAHIIVRKADECEGDYKILLAIAGNESGFGRIPYKLYNPFGYLDGVQYRDWEHALEVISCAISRRFIKPCSGDLNCIVRTYAGPSDDKARWVYNINWFMNKIN